ncbi:MAG: alpha/beta fold hydrolase [Deltaproteobacteria bacterium]|nr:alpha/beta fold hydrolase [Deltaproteobacteria bacterium]MBI3388796.1 alpha/beta fold hydrolase [Deltaproteobacteria bacterium]
MPYVDRNGVRIYYEDRGAGPAILLTHGYTATLRMWDRQVDAFADRYRMICWDMRGHGESDSPDDAGAYSHAATVADMTAILDTCGVAEAIVGGLSLGGFMSLAFHLAHRDRVRALMLFDTGPGYKKDDGRAQWNRLAESYAARFEAQGLAALGNSSEVRVAKHHSAQGLAHAARGMLAQRDAAVIEALPHIAVPTLLLAGANDKPFLAGMDYMAAKIPTATKVLIDDAGHAPNIEQPAAFNEAVASFLARAVLSSALP